MREFGEKAYEETVYINFDNNLQMKELFSVDMRIERIITGIELYVGHKINAENTLLIFDEIQEVPKALSALKYFNEAREIQGRILAAYEQDFSKHAPNEIVPRIRMLWNSIPAQLTKENKKFIYGIIKEGARAKDYEMALMWLTDCGLVHKVHRVITPNIPLKAYEDLKAFKLFLVDVGLLGCMVRLNQTVLLDGNELFKEFKGALTEQYVLQQIKTLKGVEAYYWTNDRGNAEVNFLVDNGNEVIPIEVKAETNLKAKSLKTFHEKFTPKTAIRTAMTDYKQEDWLLNLPLWAVEMTKRG